MPQTDLMFETRLFGYITLFSIRYLGQQNTVCIMFKGRSTWISLSTDLWYNFFAVCLILLLPITRENTILFLIIFRVKKSMSRNRPVSRNIKLLSVYGMTTFWTSYKNNLIKCFRFHLFILSITKILLKFRPLYFHSC